MALVMGAGPVTEVPVPEAVEVPRGWQVGAAEVPVPEERVGNRQRQPPAAASSSGRQPRRVAAIRVAPRRWQPA